MNSSLMVSVLTGALAALSCASHAASQKACRPNLTFKQTHFSEIEPSTQERKWTAIVSVDSSRCASNSPGTFAVGFLREKEGALELEFREQFAWITPFVNVEVTFSADEGVTLFWIDNITPCACSGR
jgi:hypothetical protein